MHKKLPIIIMVAFALVLTAGCLKRAAKNQDRRAWNDAFAKYGPLEDWGAACGNVERDVNYAPGEKDDDYLTLDVHWNDHEGTAPILVQIHGGGWEIGEKDALNSVFRSKYLCNQGYVVVNVNYRMMPGHPIQTQVNDVMGAVVWAKENAAEYGGDPARVGVLGGSAGGHLAAMVAWASNDDYFTPTGHANSEFDSDVLAAVPFYGVFDLQEMLTLKNSAVGGVALNYFTGATGSERDEIMSHISPDRHVRAGLPPTFFVCGDQDDFKLYPQSVRFEKELRDLGVPTGLYTAKGAVHGFDTAYGEPYTQEAMKATTAWFDQYVKNAAP